jgi:hypothetical protein
MGTFSTCAAVAAWSVVLVGCVPRQDNTQQPNAAPAPSAGYNPYPPPAQSPQAGYPQQAPAPAPTYAQYPQAPPAPQPAPPPPAPAPVPPPAPSASAAMAVPGQMALACQNDVPCVTHRCNTQYGKCAFPCQSNVDCIAPNACVMGLCVPPMPAMPGPAPASSH